MLKVKTGGDTASFAVAGVMLLVGAMMSLSLRTRKVAVAVEETVTVGAYDEEELALQEINR
jgi:hypothetical protein